jgi:glycosyltransferase involved in cell wall biosynthesis
LNGLDRSVGGMPLYHLDADRFESTASEIPGLEEHHPEKVAQLALSQWNVFLKTGAEVARRQFTDHVSWLLRAEKRINPDLSVWPVATQARGPDAPTQHLSAGAQGRVGSVLLRSYLLIGVEAHLATARRALRGLEIEILDGGVGSVVGKEGFFLEDVAVYPAAHNLSGFLVGLLGLHEYFKLSKDQGVGDVIERVTSTFHSLVGLYDSSFWTRADLLTRRLATNKEHSFHITALKAMAMYSCCEHCAKLADDWAAYRGRLTCHVRRHLAETVTRGRRGLVRTAGRLVLSARDRTVVPANRDLVCIALPGFPLAGGTRAIVNAMASAMSNEWDVVYLTNSVGQNPDGLRIEKFGGAVSTPWQFPTVWFYAAAGLVRLAGLVRRGDRFRLILPQDGSYTAFFSGIVGKAYGARIVSVEHGTVMLPYSRIYRTERVAQAKTQVGIRRLAYRFRLALYWPSLHFMARAATRLTDQFLVAGDEIEETYSKQLGVHPSRIVRFNPAIDTAAFAPLTSVARGRERARVGIATDDLVIVMNGRLAPEKGLDIALAAVARARAALPLDLRSRLRMVVAGDGPLRAEVEAIMRESGLDSISLLWGEAEPGQVAILLGIADIFLYTSLRGTNTSLSVLEAMAAGCAVVASDQPRSHAKLLADGRGVSTHPGDLGEVTAALVSILQDGDMRKDMGKLAREYVTRQYSLVALKRALLRATNFSPAKPGGT